MAKGTTVAQSAEDRDIPTGTDLVAGMQGEILGPTGGGTQIETLDGEMSRELEGLDGLGMSENVDDRGTPLLYIAQKGSPVVNAKKPEYIEGMNVGDVYNNITGRRWAAESSPLGFWPCYFRVRHLEWTPQDQGGGFHGAYDRGDPIVSSGTPRADRRDIIDLPNGHELVMTHEYFVILEDGLSPIVIPMSSTQLKASQRMQAMIAECKVKLDNGRVITKPAFSNKYALRTVYAENEKGDWYRFAPSMVGPERDMGTFRLCKEFALACKNGDIQVAAPVSQDGLGGGPVLDATIAV